MTILFILTNRIPKQFKNLKATSMVQNLGKINGELALTSTAREVTKGDYTFEKVLALSYIEARQLDDLFAPADPERFRINSLMTSGGFASYNGSNANTS